jgi:chromosome segregation ATPase
MVQTIEATMARILQQLEECSVPLKELEGMRQEEAQAQQDTQSQLSLLSEQLARAKATSNLSEYEETMRDLSSSDLMPRFRFGPDQLANIDDHLTSMENKVLASISSQKRSTYVNTALLALIIGTILAWWF